MPFYFQDNFASDAFFDMAGGLLQLYTNVMLVSSYYLVANITSLLILVYIYLGDKPSLMVLLHAHVPCTGLPSELPNTLFVKLQVSPFLMTVCGSCLKIQILYLEQQKISLTELVNHCLTDCLARKQYLMTCLSQVGI